VTNISSLQNDGPSRAGVGMYGHSIGCFAKSIGYDLTLVCFATLCHIFTFYLLFVNCSFSEKKSHHHDDDSGMGPSISTATKSSMVSEVSCCFPQLKCSLCSCLCVTIVSYYTLGSSGQGARGGT